jgi:hypothetical protein
MSTNRFRVLGLVIVLALVALALAPSPAFALYCHRQNLDDVWIYYSDPGLTHYVGTCEDDCGSCWCSGQQTQYFTVTTTRNC